VAMGRISRFPLTCIVALTTLLCECVIYSSRTVYFRFTRQWLSSWRACKGKCILDSRTAH